MTKKLLLLAALLVVCPQLWGRGKIQGWCENGNRAAYVAQSSTATPATTKFQQSFPSCTVTVYNPGTVTLATIYSDMAGTAKANPFTAASSGQWFFYSNTLADVKLSGGGISTPFTLGDLAPENDLGILNAESFSGATTTIQMDAAVTACGASKCVILIPSTMGTGSPTTIPSNVTFWDMRGGTPLSGDLGNSTSVNVADSGVVYINLDQARNASATKSTVARQSMNQVGGSIPASETQGGIIGQVYSSGTLTSVGASSVLAGVEAVASINSNTQTIPDARGLTASVTYGTNETTANTQGASIYAQALSKNSGATGPVNAFSLIAESNSAGSTRNFSGWFQGDMLLNNQASGVLSGVCAASCNGNSIYQQSATGSQFPWVTFGGATAGADTILIRPLSNTKGHTWTAQNGTTFWMRLLGGALSVGNWSVDPTAGAVVIGTDAATTTLASNAAGVRSLDSAQGNDWRFGNNVTGAVAKTDFCITNATGFAYCGLRATSTYTFHHLFYGTDPKGDVSGNCADSAGDAACGSASAGSIVIDAADTATVVSTSAVTANSQIFLTNDSSLGTRLSVTCNTQSSLTLGTPRVTARSAGVSFTITIEVGPTTNPMCVSYFIMN